MQRQIREEFEIPEELAGKRLDQALASLMADYSRALLQGWIKEGQLTVDGAVVKPKTKVLGGEKILLSAEIQEQGEWEAEDIPLDVVYEDESLLVINKPVGLVVHPATGNRSGTLLNALLFRNKDQNLLPRAGIVHRLDKDTSGLTVVAKTLAAHTSLVRQLQEKSVNRTYQAVVFGQMTGGKRIDLPIARHPAHRTKMVAVDDSDEISGAKEAVTHIRLIKKYKDFTHIKAQLETGRTHQIRVHMSHIGYPLVGDQTYGGRLKMPKGASQNLRSFLESFKRQALHAMQLGLIHPESGEYMEWEQEAPDDFKSLLLTLDEESRHE